MLVVTGAGVSAESGVPTFRGAGGYWRSHDPAALATQRAFDDNPALVWEWYRERRERIAGSAPNAAHQAITQLGLTAADFLLLTQNVDDLHARADDEGRRLSAAQMVQIHGDIFNSRCERCDYRHRDWRQDVAPVPACPVCGRRLRPGVVWFGEQLPAAEVARVETFLDRGHCDTVMVIGTTASFGYILDWASRAAAGGGEIIEINPDETPLSSMATRCVRKPAAAAVPELVSLLRSRSQGARDR